MTRKSKRGFEQFDTGSTEHPIDVREHVMAPFVTYDDENPLTEDDVPEEWVAPTTTGCGGVTHHVLERGEDA